MTLHIARIAVFFIGLYLLDLGASYALFRDTQGVLDTADANKTIFDTEPRMAVYNRALLSQTSKKIVLLGSSNVREGLRPNQLALYFPRLDIHNVSVGASNIKQLGELVQLVLEAVPQESHRELTIVLGVWYGSFVDDGNRWKSGHTDVAVEMLRYGLYRENGTQLPIPKISSDKMPYAILAIRPFMLASYVYHHGIKGIKTHLNAVRTMAEDFLNGEVPPHKVSDYDVHVVTTEEKEMAIRFWEEYMGPSQGLSDSGFNLLLSIANSVSSAGAKLVLIDMPIPSWHRDHVPYDRVYRAHLLPYLEKMSLLPGFSYGNMREKFNDDDFYDSAHPRPKVTQKWAELAAHFILPALVK